VDSIKPVDRDLEKRAAARLDKKTKPVGSLGRLEEVACRVVAITGQENPSHARKTIITMAGDHGVVEEGVSLFPPDTTVGMVRNFVGGGAGVNVLARHVGASVVVVDMGVNADLSDLQGAIQHRKVARGTANFTRGPAMTREQAVLCLEHGIQVVDGLCAGPGVDILGTGDMGIANTTPSAAMLACLAGLDPEEVTGRGTGINDEALRRKVEVIRRGLAVNKPDKGDPLDVLAKVGGLEIGGLGGLVLGAAAHRIPVVVDGFIAGAGALVACELCPAARDYVFASHRSAEKGAKALLARLRQDPLLDLGFRLGEGTGAALAMGLVEAAIKVLREMASFESANVAGPLG
jgi:nicotinate-nucleotide--dimethylbenzimidazole phosphoribosyltransferase